VEKVFSMNIPTTASYLWSTDTFSLSPAISKLFANFHRPSHLLRHFMSSVTSETGSDVTRRESDHGFLSVLNTNFRSMAARSEVKCDFSMVNNGGLSILATRRHLQPEVTSLFDSSTTVSY
jgi:hypothetical protein